MLSSIYHIKWGKTCYDGCFSKGIGPLCRIENTIVDRFVYKNILDKHMLPYSRRNVSRNWIFQYKDNDPKHGSKFLLQYFIQKKINVIFF